MSENRAFLLEALSSVEAARRLAIDGFNELPVALKRNLVHQAWDVAREPMLLLLLGPVPSTSSSPNRSTA